MQPDTLAVSPGLLLNPTFWSMVESVLTSAALIVAGIWTYRLFVQKRQRFPRARVEHHVATWDSPGGLLLRVTLKVENRGDVLLRIVSGKVWVSGLRPWAEPVRAVLEGGRTVLTRSNCEIPWPLIAECEWNRGVEEVEPEEEEYLHFDFVLAEPWRTVQVYSHLENASKRSLWTRRRRDPVGWNTTTVHELPTCEPEPLMTDKKAPGPKETRQGPPKQRPPSRPPVHEQGPPKTKPAPHVPKPTPNK